MALTDDQSLMTDDRQKKPETAHRNCEEDDLMEMPDGVVQPSPPIPTDNHRYVCGNCNKGYSSHQALGGHMTCHRTPKPPASAKRHRCSDCRMDFKTGQALGGHMRKHYKGNLRAGKNPRTTSSENSSTGSGSGSEVMTPSSGLDFDLNLPPPPEA